MIRHLPRPVCRSLVAMFVFAGLVLVATPVLARTRPSTMSSPRQPTLNAPGYCASSGGDTSFEFISGVTVTRQSGEILRIKVDVYIANPTGCTAGNPCPEYDDSPEAVNVWIDWNGDNTWSPAEQVIDQFGTGYLNINYSGTMTFVQDVPIPPTHAGETYLRANLGWGHDPGDPCEPAWQWGNVFDKAVKLENVAVLSVASTGAETPLDGITDPVWQTSFGAAPKCDLNPPSRNLPFAGGFSGPGPTLDVTLDACPSLPSYTPRVDYEWKIPATAVPFADRTGSGSFTGWTGKIPLTLPGAVGKTSVELTFDIFDDLGNKVTRKQKVKIDELYVGLDKALAPVASPKKVWIESATQWGSGGNTPTSIGSRLVPGIFGHGGWLYEDPAVAWQGLVEGTGTKGNCYTMSNMWDAMARVLGVPGTGVSPTTGSTSRGFVTKPGKAQSFDPAQAGNAHPAGGGIDRWMFGSHQVGSLGGSYYDPTFNNQFAPLGAFIIWNITGGAAADGIGTYLPAELGHKIYLINSLPPWGNWEYRPATALQDAPVAMLGPSALGATLQGPYTWSQPDVNADGQAEALRLSGNINVTGAGLPENFSFLGTLSAGATTLSSRASSTAMRLAGGSLADAGPGLHAFSIDFSGEDIRTSALGGPYAAHLILLGQTGSLDDSTTTSSPAYSSGSFGEHAARLGSATDAGADDSSNGLFDRLAVSVPLTVSATSTVGVSVALTVPGDGAPLQQRGASATFAAGSHVMIVSLDGRLIRARGVNGPYDLSIQLSDATGLIETRARSSVAYLATAFEAPLISVTGAGSDAGDDDNGNGKIDDLRVSLPITAGATGDYQSSATLWKGTTSIATASGISTLPAGPTTLTLHFRGTDISTAGLDGPYDVRGLRVNGPDGALALAVEAAHTTSAYLASQFDAVLSPLVSLTGSYSSSVVDLNANGKSDELRFNVEVVAALSGNVVANAFLHTPSGEQIEWSSGFAPATAGVPVTITIPFQGRRIFGKGENGPYEIRDLLVYQTGDPDRSVEATASLSTAAYAASSFEPAPLIIAHVSQRGVTPIAGALLTLDPLEDFDYTSATGDSRLILAGDPVTISLAPVPGYADDNWAVMVDGVYAGHARSATITPGPNQVTRVDFVTGGTLAVDPVPGQGSAMLAAAAPNPARIGAEVRLRYAIPPNTTATATVYDVNGRPVCHLASRAALPAQGDLVWNSRNDSGVRVPPGVYVVRLVLRGDRAASKQLSQKVILIR